MESIIIFILFAVVSSLFNKDKKGKKTTRKNPNPMENREHQQQKIPTQKKTNRRTSGGFGDLVKELKTDFDDVFKEGQQQTKGRTGTYRQRLEPAKETSKIQEESYEYENEYQQYMAEEAEERYQINKEKEKKVKDIKPVKKDSVYRQEIGRKSNKGRISFNKEAVTRGIIMAEVLGKPKSMRR